MGQTNSNQNQEEETTITSSTPQQEEAPVKGTDTTYHVSDLLRKTEREVQFDDIPQDQIIREDFKDVPGAFLIHNVCTESECLQFIEISEEMGYAPSPLTILSGNFQNSKIDEGTRNIRDSSRVLCDVPKSMLETLRDRIIDHLPETVECEDADWKLMKSEALNGRWRFNKYEKGQKFAPHFDAGYTRNVNEKTLLTFILYLNDGIDGGETIFFPGGKMHSYEKTPSRTEVRVAPKTGLALLFFQAGKLNWRHEGAPHNSDGKYKYIIRSDIMYERVNRL